MAHSCPALRPRFLSALLTGALLAAAGCDSGPKVYPVKGKIVNKGRGHVKDLAGYSVQFQSLNDPAETPGGPIEEDGSFILYTRVGGKVTPGVKAGTYRACLVPPPAEGGSAPPLIIPRRYTKFETANLQFDIQAGLNELMIEVDRDAR